MSKLFEQFSLLAIKYKDRNIRKLYNHFANRLSDKEEQDFVFNHFKLFIKTGEAARTLPYGN